MLWLSDSIEAVRDFIVLGGPMMIPIGWTIFLMWILILERLLFFQTGVKELARQARDSWESRSERRSWYSHRIRDAMLSDFSMAVNRSVPLIQTLVALCPLLGLMGTVTGMVEVFDVISLAGTGNARSMAAGVSRATIPTMAGMVGALSGVLLATIVGRRVEREVELLDESLTMDH